MSASGTNPLDLLVKDLPSDQAEAVRQVVQQSLSAGEAGGKPVERDLNPLSDKYYAFRWGDLVQLSDLLDAAKLAGGADVQLLVLKKLLSVWSRLRSTRVELTRDQAMVLLAVKRGASEVATVAETTGLAAEDVKTLLMTLENMRSVGDRGVVRFENGRWTTDF